MAASQGCIKLPLQGVRGGAGTACPLQFLAFGIGDKLSPPRIEELDAALFEAFAGLPGSAAALPWRRLTD